MDSCLYNQILSAINNRSYFLALDDSPSEEQVRDVVRQVMLDDPGIFWFAGQYDYDASQAGIFFRYTYPDFLVSQIQKGIADVLKNSFRLEYVRTLSVHQQVVYVYKWLSVFCKYEPKSSRASTIYSVFGCRNSASEGYAKAAQFLFGLLGIRSRLVFGRLHSDKSEDRHCWNIVNVEGQYYHFDASLSDIRSAQVAVNAVARELLIAYGVYYDLLCVSSDKISRTRTIEDVDALPPCPDSWPRELVEALLAVDVGKRVIYPGEEMEERRKPIHKTACQPMKSAPGCAPFYSQLPHEVDAMNFMESLSQAGMQDKVTYYPETAKRVAQKVPFLKRLFGKKNQEAYSSIFAPAEVKKRSHMLTQVFFHLFEETEAVRSFAAGADPDTQIRSYKSLSMILKKGDRLEVEFNVYGETRLMSERKSVQWKGSFTHCSFDYFVPTDIDVESLSCVADLYVNGAMIGEMRFLTKIVDHPRPFNPEIISHNFKRIFISYAHQDAPQVKLLALAYKTQGVDYFYDRDSLAPGDVYEEKIFDYIDSADLFILCWSKNAAVSDYVATEKGRAMLHAYPQQCLDEATLKMCPVSIEPRAELPEDMKGIYNFEVI